jgi:hypothetical protein
MFSSVFSFSCSPLSPSLLSPLLSVSMQQLRSIQRISCGVTTERSSSMILLLSLISSHSLPQVLGQLKQYEKAIFELHLAMSSCPPGSDVSLAIQEVDRIEGLLQGHDYSLSNDSYDPSLQSISPSL